MKMHKKALAAAVGVGLLTTLLPLTAHAADEGPNAVALTESGTRLGRFNVDRPSGLPTPIGGAITGLAGDVRLVGIDRRVQNGRLYGVGNAGGLYLMSGSTASKVGQLSVPLVGTSFGVDFNPAANALRIVSNQAQNLRQPFGTGNNPVGDTVTDTPLTQGGVPAGNIAGAAYTNNDLLRSHGHDAVRPRHRAGPDRGAGSGQLRATCRRPASSGPARESTSASTSTPRRAAAATAAIANFGLRRDSHGNRQPVPLRGPADRACGVHRALPDPGDRHRRRPGQLRLRGNTPRPGPPAGPSARPSTWCAAAQDLSAVSPAAYGCGQGGRGDDCSSAPGPPGWPSRRS